VRIIAVAKVGVDFGGCQDCTFTAPPRCSPPAIACCPLMGLCDFFRGGDDAALFDPPRLISDGSTAVRDEFASNAALAARRFCVSENKK
jgi:hypothetical protein